MILLPVIAILFHGFLLEDNDCAFLEGKLARGKPTHHAYPLENSQVAERNSVAQPGSMSYFMQRQTLFLFLH